ncbi:hypothetical protein PVAP13_3KG085927 [Panicum virgatum]|uniref:Uncharacterized protein n=1 Tax=Panicum virgatum TaxID=38727 RepID=A0A8T0UGX6_PANVG|nr:hypothetical protein PVAP13_3KG085927 [Panicum virgatum]
MCRNYFLSLLLSSLLHYYMQEVKWLLPSFLLGFWRDALNSSLLPQTPLAASCCSLRDNLRLLLVVLVVRDGRCSCYFWNFEQQRIHVLDPLMMRCCISSVHRRHGQNISILNEGISRCIDTFFNGWNVDMIGWDRCYTVGLGASCHSNNSGLFAMHYARAFDGIQLLWELKTPEHGINRAELLYQLLSMPGNFGDIPELLIDLLEI